MNDYQKGIEELRRQAGHAQEVLQEILGEDNQRVTDKVHTIDISIRQIDAYLAMILKGEISPASGFSLISKYAKSIEWECNGFFIGKADNNE